MYMGKIVIIRNTGWLEFAWIDRDRGNIRKQGNVDDNLFLLTSVIIGRKYIYHINIVNRISSRVSGFVALSRKNICKLHNKRKQETHLKKVSGIFSVVLSY